MIAATAIVVTPRKRSVFISSALLGGESEVGGELLVSRHLLLDKSSGFCARHGQREQVLLLQRSGIAGGLYGCREGICPPLVIGIADVRADIEPAHDRPLD